MAGARDERFKVLRDWAETRDTDSSTISPEASGVADAPRLAQRIYASLLMSTEAGTEAHSIVDNAPGENGLDAWPRSAQRLDPA